MLVGVVLLGTVFLTPILAQDAATVVRTPEVSTVEPGQTVTITLAPSVSDLPFYAVQESWGELTLSTHTADSLDSGVFVQLGSGGFTYDVQVPANATPGQQFVISGIWWTDPADKQFVTPNQTVVTVRTPASTLSFNTQPGGALVDATLDPQPVVHVLDIGGNLATDFTGAVTLAITPGTGAPGATLSGTTTVDAADGVATFTELLIDTVGTNYTLTASSPDLTGAISNAFGITEPVDPGTMTRSIAAGSVEPGQTVTLTLTPSVPDLPFYAVQESWGDLILSTHTADSLDSGVFVQLGSGGFTYDVQVPADATPGQQFAISGIWWTDPADKRSVTPDQTVLTVRTPPSALSFNTQPGGALVDATLDPQPIVHVVDIGGNLATDFTGAVTLGITSGTGAPGATLSGTTTVDAMDGVATFTGLSIDIASLGYTLTASNPSLLSTVSSPFDVSGAGQECAIQDLKITNRTDVALTFAWWTFGVCEGTVSVASSPSEIIREVSDDRGASWRGQTHHVTVGGLEPTSEYFLSAHSRNERSSVSSELTSMLTAPTLSPPPTYAVFGLVFNGSGTQSLDEGIVQYWVEDADQQGSPGTSQTFSSLVDPTGSFYNANLGTLRTTDLGTFFQFSGADTLCLLFIGAGQRHRFNCGPIAESSPRAEISVAPRVCNTFVLPTGLSLIALPGEPLRHLRAADVVELASGAIHQIDRWIPDGSIWESFEAGHPFANFPMEVGVSYFVHAAVPLTWEYCGSRLDAPLQINLRAGLNPLPIPESEQQYTAASVVEGIEAEGGEPRQLDRWNERLGRWESFVPGFSSDFEIDRARGYFIIVGVALLFTPR